MTLIELLTVIAIVAVLLVVTIPVAASMVDSMRLSAHANAFLSALHLTRSEAIKRNARATLCKSGDGAGCSNSGGWHQGWIIFHDGNSNGTREAGEVLIHQAPTLAPDFRLTGNQNVANYVSFSPSGGTLLVSGAFQAGTLTLCRASTSSVDARQIVISSTGRPRIQRLTVESCN